jgi:hypothetical protein
MLYQKNLAILVYIGDLLLCRYRSRNFEHFFFFFISIIFSRSSTLPHYIFRAILLLH